MKDEKLKLKNIKDLEYNHLLNKQNIFVIILGTAIISTILSNTLPGGETKLGLIAMFVLIMVLSLLHYANKLKKKIEEIKIL